MTAKRFSQSPTNVAQLIKSELLFTLSVNISCTANVLCPIWQDGFVHFRPLGFQTPGFSSSFVLLATAFIATSSLNAKGIFFLFFLYSSFIELLFETQQKSILIERQDSVVRVYGIATFHFSPLKKTPLQRQRQKKIFILYQRTPCSILIVWTPFPQVLPTNFTNKIIPAPKVTLLWLPSPPPL